MRSSSSDMAHMLEACHFGVAAILETWKRNITANSSESDKEKEINVEELRERPYSTSGEGQDGRPLQTRRAELERSSLSFCLMTAAYEGGGKK
jgi:hypothetical protein